MEGKRATYVQMVGMRYKKVHLLCTVLLPSVGGLESHEFVGYWLGGLRYIN